MVVDAESRLEDVLGAGNVGVFYKPKQDPRVTRVGAFIRRYSIDELPQLFNVLGGSMSLVGPRPQVSLEVDQYDAEIGRRLLVKPGLTGLWQVSGRNNLTLEESVRLDLYYVENWTVTGDLLILLRTLRAVVGRDGAY
jgi:lipopolysaccharide/colanic/teichoic acid biosynthesis glycosyltransferase